jgi:tetratricopeptide (TPR) repeat protein
MNLRGSVIKMAKLIIPVLISFMLLTGSSGICRSSSADDQVHELTGKALNRLMVGDYDGAINYYRAALKFTPDDESIQWCIGHILYLKDKQKGIKPNPKAEILLDSLQVGKGNWEASIGYLKGALAAERDKQRSRAIRDALCELEGIYAQVRYEELQAQLDKDLKELTIKIVGGQDEAIRLLLREGFRGLEIGNYESAIQKFKDALDMEPNDMRIREMLNYTEGLLFAQQDSLRRWAEGQKQTYEKLRAEAISREAEAHRALEQSQRALKLSEESKDAEATSISQRAINIAKEALAKARALILRLETRSKAVEKNRSLGSKGRLGIAGVVRGSVYRNTEKGWVSLDPNTPFTPGEELRTGSDGFAELILTDGSTIQIGPGTTMKLIKITRGQSFYEMLKGRLHAEMSCLKAAQKRCREIQFRPGEVVAIRGTEFDIEAPSNGPVTVTVMEGVLEITNKEKGRETKVKAGEKVVITAVGEIGEPSRTDIRSMKRWWED